MSNVCKWTGCRQMFNTPQNLLAHLQLRHSKSDSSKSCLWEACRNFNFFDLDQSAQENHLKAHLGLGSFICPYENCSRSYKRLDPFLKHYSSHPPITSSPTISESASPSPSSAPKKTPKRATKTPQTSRVVRTTRNSSKATPSESENVDSDHLDPPLKNGEDVSNSVEDTLKSLSNKFATPTKNTASSFTEENFNSNRQLNPKTIIKLKFRGQKKLDSPVQPEQTDKPADLKDTSVDVYTHKQSDNSQPDTIHFSRRELEKKLKQFSQNIDSELDFGGGSLQSHSKESPGNHKVKVVANKSHNNLNSPNSRNDANSPEGSLDIDIDESLDNRRSSSGSISLSTSDSETPLSLSIDTIREPSLKSKSGKDHPIPQTTTSSNPNLHSLKFNPNAGSPSFKTTSLKDSGLERATPSKTASSNKRKKLPVSRDTNKSIKPAKAGSSAQAEGSSQSRKKVKKTKSSKPPVNHSEAVSILQARTALVLESINNNEMRLYKAMQIQRKLDFEIGLLLHSFGKIQRE
ncbi:hypothetical protein BB560_000253 [Smittium megazygosporum]|uniref:C2H2-type domain-containing protein n=1 Tax=Smittium megazygosporum TaxID=133381 RepID=A0A2T9ZL05_9FUNG|nr:hypothetical protein BB560_000253 [Smittium megazygosporum]